MMRITCLKFFVFYLFFACSSANAQESQIDIDASLYDSPYTNQSNEKIIEDPFENFNRPMFHFNKILYKYILNPPTQIYRKGTPSFFRTGVVNLFDNLQEPVSIVNNILALELRNALRCLFRFTMNSTLGLLGSFDVASYTGIQKSPFSFGDTLRSYGAKSGPYLVLPILGPSNFRDSLGLATEFYSDPLNQIKSIRKYDYYRYGVESFIRYEQKEGLLKTASTMSIDEYASTKKFYNQYLNKNEQTK
jgi:phospholipid-binding lipoprotein MlaA